MTQCAVGQRSFPFTQFRLEKIGSSDRAASKPPRRLSEDELRVSASPADVGMLPIPSESWIDISVVTGDAAEGEEHSADTCDAKKQEDSDRGSQCCGGLRMLDYTDEPYKSPKECETNRDSPEHQRSSITTRVWRRGCLSGKGLRCSGTEPGGVSVRSLLIHQWSCYHVHSSTSVALIGRLLLNNGSHLIVPDLATACDTWFLNTDSSALLSRAANSHPKNIWPDFVLRD
jgi:hypothetical protein